MALLWWTAPINSNAVRAPIGVDKSKSGLAFAETGLFLSYH
jgi:hypothetical protein